MVVKVTKFDEWKKIYDGTGLNGTYDLDYNVESFNEIIVSAVGSSEILPPTVIPSNIFNMGGPVSWYDVGSGVKLILTFNGGTSFTVLNSFTLNTLMIYGR